MVQRTGSDGGGNVHFIQNNFYHDAFFLKAIGLSLFDLQFHPVLIAKQFLTVRATADSVGRRTAPRTMSVSYFEPILTS
jgi:hypothetical protein